MIRIDRPDVSPDVLLTAGRAQTAADCILYDAKLEEYSKGSQRFEFKRSIYAHSSVKQRLCNAQHKKCCYCESYIVSVSHGAVEHYRPKAAVKQDRRQPKTRPGYYWLAYRWENLLFVCDVCNTKKSDLFPLRDPSRRAHSHHDGITAEDPLLVDPSSSDPRLDIRFRLDAPVGVTTRGRKTIKLLALDRPELSEERRQWLDQLRSFVKVLRILDSDTASKEEMQIVAEIQEKLANAIKPSSRYSSMAIDSLESA